MKPTLFVLAAGMGSRYGGLKQLDGLGPNGETIMDYSIFDALRGGFGKVVFVISSKISGIRFFLNMKVIFLVNWYSSLSTICRRASRVPRDVLNRGELIMPC